MKYVFVLTLLILPGLYGNAQKLEQNEIDEFTKKVIKRTSWEPMWRTMGSSVFFRTSNLDDIYVLSLRMMLGGSIFSIQQSEKLMLKMDDDSVIILNCAQYALTCKGCGAIGFGGSTGEGLQAEYPIDKDQLDYLFNHKVKKIRIYTSKGFIEESVNEKRSESFLNLIKLVQ